MRGWHEPPTAKDPRTGTTFDPTTGVIIEDGHISGVQAQAPDGAEGINLEGQLLLPGFIDVQVNGVDVDALK